MVCMDLVAALAYNYWMCSLFGDPSQWFEHLSFVFSREVFEELSEMDKSGVNGSGDAGRNVLQPLWTPLLLPLPPSLPSCQGWGLWPRPPTHTRRNSSTTDHPCSPGPPHPRGPPTTRLPVLEPQWAGLGQYSPSFAASGKAVVKICTLSYIFASTF